MVKYLNFYHHWFFYLNVKDQRIVQQIKHVLLSNLLELSYFHRKYSCFPMQAFFVFKCQRFSWQICLKKVVWIVVRRCHLPSYLSYYDLIMSLIHMLQGYQSQSNFYYEKCSHCHRRTYFWHLLYFFEEYFLNMAPPIPPSFQVLFEELFLQCFSLGISIQLNHSLDPNQHNPFHVSSLKFIIHISFVLFYHILP